MDVVHTSGQCPRCGKLLPKDAPESLCAACLLAAGAEPLTSSFGIDDAPTASSASGYRSAGIDGQRLTSGQLWGPYRIGRLLGKGGMGEVYEAEHTGTGRRMALKVLNSQLQDAHDRARFLREGQLAASISHPHTVYVFGSEEISGIPVISMELLPGGTLKDRVAAQGPLGSSEAVSAILDIIGGLDAAHLAGILHRDIKPSNCFTGSEGSVKVGDFGLSISTLARDVDQDLAAGGFQGTPQFASPEQLRGEPLDVRADVYAVGATLYYLLTGKPVFDDAHDLHDLVVRVTTEQPKSPRFIRPEIPQGLASVVMQCLAKEPARRPPSYAALAEMLRPFSSREDRPVRPGVRVLAGFVDSAIMGVPVLVWRSWNGNAIAGNAAVSPWIWLLSFAYYLVIEGFWGASLGKRLFGLRVTSTDGAAASWAQIARRTSVFFVPSLLRALPIPIAGSAGLNAFLTTDPSRAVGGAIFSLALSATLFLTARRRNGWAALHDLGSNTRVISRSLGAAQRVGSDAARTQAGTVSPAAGLRYGPFTVVSDAGDTGSGRLFAGFDPVLRRPVWIHAVPLDTPSISASRRDVSRVGRLHWLTGRRTGEENWDAFEAPGGGPFLTREGPAPGWPATKLWLLDVANELMAGLRDGSAPKLGLDRLWLRNDGRVVLLDFPAPGNPRTTAESLGGPDLTPVGLLSAVAARGLFVGANTLAAQNPLPLSARALLDRWSGPTPPTLDDAQTALVNAAAAPDRVSCWRRAVPVVLACVPMLFIIMSALLVLPGLFRFMNPQNLEILRLLTALHQPNPPVNSRLADPEYRDAVGKYLAGRYGAVLNDPAFWNSVIMQNRSLRDLRQTADDIRKRHPSVSAEELTQASAVVVQELERGRQRRPEREDLGLFGVAAIIVGFLSALTALLALGSSVISSVIVPGGIVTRLMGLAVVTRDGKEISRSRSLARVVVAWLPVILWMVWLSTSPRVQGFVPTRAASLPAAGLALGALAAGAIWAVARPTRGLHDMLVGTWIVPR